MALITLTENNFDDIVNSNEIVVVDFWAEWCGPCQSFAKIYEQVAEQHPNIIFGKINTDEEQKLAADFQIRSIPMLMILRQRIMVFFEAGVLPASALNDLIAQAQTLDMKEVKKKLTAQA